LRCFFAGDNFTGRVARGVEEATVLYVVAFTNGANICVQSSAGVSSCSCLTWLMPLAVGWVSPLAPVVTCALYEWLGLATKVLSKGAPSREIISSSWSAPTCKQYPALLWIVDIPEPSSVGSVTGNSLTRLSLYKETICCISLPVIKYFALGTGAFIAKSLCYGIFSLTEQMYFILIRNFTRIISLEWTPYRKNDYSFCWWSALHSKVARAEAICHEKTSMYILTSWNHKFRIVVVNLFDRGRKDRRNPSGRTFSALVILLGGPFRNVIDFTFTSNLHCH